MLAQNFGAEQRQLLYLVPKSGHESAGEAEPRPKIIPFAPALRKRLPTLLVSALVMSVLFMPQLFAHASTAITIDTDVLFGSVNDWISTFLPIFAIGLGIAIALAIIAIVGDSILMGLRRGVR